MPFPQNLDTARAVEAEVRDAGAVPATIAVIGRPDPRRPGPGRARRRWRRAEGVRKLSRADLAVALAEGWTGATTVAATMICARLAGIEVFATGGIGGRAPRRRDELRHLRRPRRARADPGDGGGERRQGDPRPAQDAGGAGDPRRAGHRLRPGRAARLLVAGQRPARAPSPRRPRGDRPRPPHARAASACPAASSSPTRSRPRPRSPPPRSPRTSTPRSPRPPRPGHRRQGGHALPARRDRRRAPPAPRSPPTSRWS